MKYQTISASTSSVNLGNITYGGQASYVQETQQLKAERDKREYREEVHHDIMATMMQQHQGETFGKYQPDYLLYSSKLVKLS